MFRTQRSGGWMGNLPSSQLGTVESYITEQRTHREKINKLSKVQHNLYSVLSTLLFLPGRGQVKCVWWNNLSRASSVYKWFLVSFKFYTRTWYLLFYFRKKSGIQRLRPEGLKLRGKVIILFHVHKSQQTKDNNAE